MCAFGGSFNPLWTGLWSWDQGGPGLPVEFWGWSLRISTQPGGQRLANKVLLYLGGWSWALGDRSCQSSECREALLQMKEQDLGSCAWLGVGAEGG